MILYRIYGLRLPHREELTRVFSEVQSLGIADLGFASGTDYFDIVGQSSGGYDPLIGIIGRVRLCAADPHRFPHVQAILSMGIEIKSVWEFELMAEKNPVNESALWSTLVAASQFINGWYWIGWAQDRLSILETGRALWLDKATVLVDTDRFLSFAFGVVLGDS